VLESRGSIITGRDENEILLIKKENDKKYFSESLKKQI
jgi:hypothetical protein